MVTIENFVEVNRVDSDTVELLVDTDGTGTDESFETVAQVELSANNISEIEVLFESAENVQQSTDIVVG